jgi:hypothetical protein
MADSAHFSLQKAFSVGSPTHQPRAQQGLLHNEVLPFTSSIRKCININLVLDKESPKRAPIKEIDLLKFETWIFELRLKSCFIFIKKDRGDFWFVFQCKEKKKKK